MDAVDDRLVQDIPTDSQSQSDGPSLEDVPEDYWETLRERTDGVTKHDIHSLDHLEELLSDRQFQRLMNKIE
jgi:hypothetical protein